MPKNRTDTASILALAAGASTAQAAESVGISDRTAPRRAADPAARVEIATTTAAGGAKDITVRGRGLARCSAQFAPKNPPPRWAKFWAKSTVPDRSERWQCSATMAAMQDDKKQKLIDYRWHTPWGTMGVAAEATTPFAALKDVPPSPRLLTGANVASTMRVVRRG
jgi:hypothetical protein